MLISDTDIIKGCIKHDIKAQEALFRKYAPELKKLCYRYSKTSDDAKDIFQETFIKIYRDIPGFRYEGALIGWLKRIAVNTAISFYRKKSKDNAFSIYGELPLSGAASASEGGVPFLQDGDILDPEEVNDYELALSKLSYEQLLVIIKALDPPQNIIFNMFYIENFTHRDIAKELNLSESNCRTLLHRAKKKLKDNIRVLIHQAI